MGVDGYYLVMNWELFVFFFLGHVDGGEAELTFGQGPEIISACVLARVLLLHLQIFLFDLLTGEGKDDNTGAMRQVERVAEILA